MGDLGSRSPRKSGAQNGSAGLPRQTYDAIVVGSGATGSVAAKWFADLGVRVLVLEAGKTIEQLGGYRSRARNVARAISRGFMSKRQHVQCRHATYWTTNPNFFVDDLDNPYSAPESKPFRWIRSRVTGGRTLTWDGVTPRFSDHEFTAAERDGVGINWPIRHADLAPYYGRLERYFRVHGNHDRLPHVPDGNFVGVGKLTAAEEIFRDRVHREFPKRRVIVSRGLLSERTPPRGEAHTHLSVVPNALFDAVASGYATLETDAIASRVLLHRDGRRAVGVEYVDARTGAFRAAYADLIFLCASTIESIRLLLNSATPAHPDGVGASGGLLGRYLMDHVAANIYFQLPDVPTHHQERPMVGGSAMMIPRFQNLHGPDADHLRGYALWGGIDRIWLPSFVRRIPGEAFGFLGARCEVLPHFDNHVRIDPDLKDRWSIPSVHIECEWKDNDLRIVRAARRQATEMVEAAGGEVADLSRWMRGPARAYLGRLESEWRISTPGLFVHELGGARMGKTPAESVVDPSCAVWDVKNLYVADGACWPSSGWQNPTLTQMAIAARAVHLAVTQRR